LTDIIIIVILLKTSSTNVPLNMKTKEFFQNLKNSDKQKWSKSIILSVIGYILSPLSWWNDLFINVPLAYLLTWPIGKALSFFIPINYNLYLFIFIVNYWITNLLGFILMHYGIISLRDKEYSKKNIFISLGFALLYTLIIILIAQKAGAEELLYQFRIIPSWVIK